MHMTKAMGRSLAWPDMKGDSKSMAHVDSHPDQRYHLHYFLTYLTATRVITLVFT